MKLLLDAGNTRLKWRRLADDDSLLEENSTLLADLGGLAAIWQAWPFTYALGCNVAGEAVAATIAAALPSGCDLTWLVPTAEMAGVKNSYLPPHRLGADRWAALIAAAAYPQSARIIVCAGTALTIDALTPDNRFLGGTISPGFALMRASLAESTALLTAEHGEYHPLPRQTEDAIHSGCINALTAPIARMVTHLEAQFDAVTVILTGGDARLIGAHLPVSHRIVDNLALDGLARISRL